jgi:RimJ/RimL family protein N-acetyltransferase
MARSGGRQELASGVDMRDTELGRSLVASLKATAGGPGPAVLIAVGSPPTAFLRPVATRTGHLDPRDVRALTEWRNRFVHAFLTEFVATEERTARWLTELVGPKEGKILFMVDDAGGRPFGYMGLDYIDWERAYGEADAIVRGGEAPPGQMKLALQTLLSWARKKLGLRELGVRVRSDNPALAFYDKVGYREVQRVGLRKVEEPGMIRWLEDETLEESDLSLVHMRWEGKDRDRAGNR